MFLCKALHLTGQRFSHSFVLFILIDRMLYLSHLCVSFIWFFTLLDRAHAYLCFILSCGKKNMYRKSNLKIRKYFILFLLFSNVLPLMAFLWLFLIFIFVPFTSDAGYAIFVSSLTRCTLPVIKLLIHFYVCTSMYVCIYLLQGNWFVFTSDFLFVLACALDCLAYLCAGWNFVFFSAVAALSVCLHSKLMFPLCFLRFSSTLMPHASAPAPASASPYSYQWNFEVFITLQILFRQ